VFFQQCTILTHLLIINVVIRYQFSIKINFNPTAAYSVGAKGVLVAEEHQWIQENRVIRPTLNRANVHDYLGIFKVQADRLVAKWEQNITNNSNHNSNGNSNSCEIAINDDIINLAADVIFEVGMNRQFDFLHNPDKGMAKDIMAMQEAAMFRTFRPVWYWRIPYIGQYLDGYGYAVDRVCTTINQVVEEYELSSSSSSSAANKSVSRTTFLGKLFAAMESEKIKLDRERVVGNILTLFVTGADPMSKTFLTALWHLSRDVVLQDELAAEAATVDLSSASLLELYDRVPRIKSFLHEIHRFYGVPLLLMQAQENITVGGHVIPAGQNLFLLLRYVTYQCPGVPVGPSGESAAEFCPTRWLVQHEEMKSERNVPHFSCPMPDMSTMSFLGFGHGIRSCPGRAYAEAFQYCLLIRLLQTFSFTLAANRPDVHISFDVVMGPDKDIYVNLTKKNTTATATATK
jgi:Cytochrome P450